MGLLKALVSMHANTNENLLHCLSGLYFFKMLDCVILVIKFQWNNTLSLEYTVEKKKLVFVFYLTDVARNHSRQGGAAERSAKEWKRESKMTEEGRELLWKSSSCLIWKCCDVPHCETSPRRNISPGLHVSALFWQSVDLFLCFYLSSFSLSLCCV